MALSGHKTWFSIEENFFIVILHTMLPVSGAISGKISETQTCEDKSRKI